MKKHYLAISLLFLLSCSSVVSHKESESYKIIESYKYLMEKFNKDIDVSKVFADIDITDFAESIANDKKQDVGKVLDSLVLIGERYNYKKRVFPVNKILDISDKTVFNYRVSFSEPRNNYIMAEVFPIDNEKYSDDVFLGSSEVFLFLFKDKQIIQVYDIVLDYN